MSGRFDALSIPQRFGIGLVAGIVGGVLIAVPVAALYLQYLAGHPVREMSLRGAWQHAEIFGPLHLFDLAVIAVACVIAMSFFALAWALRISGTEYGDARFAGAGELRRQGELVPIGPTDCDDRIIMGKFARPRTRAGRYMKTARFPHMMLFAPTESGKTTGWAIPNLLHFSGSVVALDIKGELFEETSRFCRGMGQRVLTFSPSDPNRSSGYNPLALAAATDDPDQRWVAILDVSNYIIEPQNAQMEGFAVSGKALFAACAMLAIQRGAPHVAEARRLLITATSEDFAAYAEQVAYPNAATEFEAAANQEHKILKSYISVVENAGLAVWKDPMVDRVTRRSDIGFDTLRRDATTVYFNVPVKRAKSYAPLIRCFFSDLAGQLQTIQPGPDEPHKVLMMLDEFDQLGRMDAISAAFKTIRGFGGRIMVISQNVAGLDAIYGRDETRSMLANAGNKVFLATDDMETCRYVSEIIGDRTRTAVSRSTKQMAPLALTGSVSEKAEGRRLMKPEEVARLDQDFALVLRTHEMPVKLHKVKWFEDPTFIARHASQSGDLPYPDPQPKVQAPKERGASGEARTCAASHDSSEFAPGTTVSPPTRVSDALQPPTARVAALIKEIPLGKLGASDRQLLSETAELMTGTAGKIEALASLTRRKPIGDDKLADVLRNVQEV
ncbi:MAG: type IV secretory system conjugative DNA transfer family protein [Pseudomonadota bacterium]